MNLVKVATGLFWLEIPERDLYLMCGCPMDSIKHLENKKFIHRVDCDAYYMESGPNAILLSDLAVQNGYFCNLAEFPILHMMYKQGMALPGHPGNKGNKPWLIGTSEQVNAQKQYIFRGNYGLASPGEFKNAGCDNVQIESMWKLKMKFNFNTILDPEELVDTTIINEEPVELRPDVFLKRTGMNCYSLTYNNETIDIDLNLGQQELYEPPYQLLPRKVKKEYFSIIHIGEGNGWDNARPCMGSIICFEGKIYLIDAGPNIEYSLDALGISVNDVEGIFHTHIHDDHFAGLTYLIMADHKIKYYAVESVMHTARMKLAALMGHDESIFDTVLDPILLECHSWNDLNGLEVKPMFSPHPVETTIFYFRALGEDGYKSYGHLADIISSKVFKSFLGENETDLSQSFYDDVWKSYLEYADVKKIDVGGGMVHGAAEDFKHDPSDIVILSHLDRHLNDEEETIGVNVDFGSAHVLIPASTDYSKIHAAEMLRLYFPKTSQAHLDMLLDCPIVDFSPETLIVEDSTRLDEVFLVLTGKVDYVFSDTGTFHEMTAGSTVGLLNGLWNEPIRGTYRANANVEALVIPKDVFLSFMTKTNALDHIKNMSRIIFDLQSTRLFGSRISNSNIVHLAQKTTTIELLPGDSIPDGWPKDLYILKKGKVEIFSDNIKIGRLKKWESWGGYPVFSILRELNIEARIAGHHPCEFYKISYDVLKEIPVVQWKLFQQWSYWEAHY
ncbi:cyclic nucleotide-binding domain-containing protein [Oceanispirochaeta crateris]|uniref:Cyclic nucleotide-binding domain-containing protein n=1 Tax=Oceanispirochaeta crateris TaxID=2518645 RepID=A0A5C1QJU8_9SPIO|nr:cyclic nucleotide-binding domain-containing protein [Oceanispirochaeta crateris]QEN07270.1 cyclic nucleotide-binding domain-containing protein [Oceanispirochaeta crateris]